MVWGKVGIVTGWDRMKEKTQRASYIRAAGKKTEWRPITIKNSAVEHQSPIVAGMEARSDTSSLIFDWLCKLAYSSTRAVQTKLCRKKGGRKKTQEGRQRRQKEGGRVWVGSVSEWASDSREQLACDLIFWLESHIISPHSNLINYSTASANSMLIKGNQEQALIFSLCN